MIIDLIIVTLSCLVAWVVSGLIVPVEVSRKPRPGIADPMPPTRAELSAAHVIDSFDVEPAVPYDGPIKALMSPYEPGCSCPHAATHGHLGGCALDTNPHYTVRRFATGGIVRGGQPVFLNEYADYRIASGAQVITTTGVDPASIPPPVSLDPPAPTGCQHPNPEPVVLTTDEVVAGVCPDCLQPLPPSSVGSEWKP